MKIEEGKEEIRKLWRDLGSRRWICLIGIGILLVLIAIPAGEKQEEQKKEESGETVTESREGSEIEKDEKEETLWDGALDGDSYETILEERLESILSQIQGAGETKVMVTVKASGKKILQTDEKWEETVINETDANGGSRENSEYSKDTETIRIGSATGSPYVIQEVMPEIEGVVVACEGGDKASIQSEITQAVQALFDIEAHKIKVCKKAS